MDPGHADEEPPVGPRPLHTTALMMCLCKRTKTVRWVGGEGTEGLPHVGSVLQLSEVEKGRKCSGVDRKTWGGETVWGKLETKQNKIKQQKT